MGGMLEGIHGATSSSARLVWAPTDFLEQQEAQLKAGIKPDRERQVLEAWKAKKG
jgi:hypothetical protein